MNTLIYDVNGIPVSEVVSKMTGGICTVEARKAIRPFSLLVINDFYNCFNFEPTKIARENLFILALAYDDYYILNHFRPHYEKHQWERIMKAKDKIRAFGPGRLAALCLQRPHDLQSKDTYHNCLRKNKLHVYTKKHNIYADILGYPRIEKLGNYNMLSSKSKLIMGLILCAPDMVVENWNGTYEELEDAVLFQINPVLKGHLNFEKRERKSIYDKCKNCPFRQGATCLTVKGQCLRMKRKPKYYGTFGGAM